MSAPVAVDLDGRGDTNVDLAQIQADIETRRVELQRELRNLDAAAKALKGLKAGNTVLSGRRGRRMSAAARRRISDAQKARWAKFKQKRTA
jgi:hypothetical protein